MVLSASIAFVIRSEVAVSEVRICSPAGLREILLGTINPGGVITVGALLCQKNRNRIICLQAT